MESMECNLLCLYSIASGFSLMFCQLLKQHYWNNNVGAVAAGLGCPCLVQVSPLNISGLMVNFIIMH